MQSPGSSHEKTPVKRLTFTDRRLGIPSSAGAGDLLRPLELESMATGKHQHTLSRLLTQQEVPVFHFAREATGILWARLTGTYSQCQTPSFALLWGCIPRLASQGAHVGDLLPSRWDTARAPLSTDPLQQSHASNASPRIGRDQASPPTPTKLL